MEEMLNCPAEHCPETFENTGEKKLDFSSYAYERAAEACNVTNPSNGITVAEVKEVQCQSDDKQSESYYIVHYYGGRNGHGSWNSYLKDIKAIFEEFKYAWLIELQNDCLDDVWDLKIGFRL